MSLGTDTNHLEMDNSDIITGCTEIGHLKIIIIIIIIIINTIADNNNNNYYYYYLQLCFHPVAVSNLHVYNL
jgi:hypothetical protein